MRFSANIFLKGEKPYKIPVNYRRNLTCLIKEAINPDDSGTDIYNKYYADKKQNTQKPFTFSVHLPVKEKIKRDHKSCFVLGDDNIRFHFSSSDPVFLIEVYNGLLGLTNDFSPFKGYKIEVKNFYMQKNSPIDSDEIVFKTYSPVLVRDIENKKGRGFISFEHKNFEENLFFSMRNLCRNFIDRDYELKRDQIEILPVKCNAVPISNYGGEIGTSGILKIKAPLEVLQLLYDAGLGAKRSQGFGMLEVVG